MVRVSNDTVQTLLVLQSGALLAVLHSPKRSDELLRRGLSTNVHGTHCSERDLHVHAITVARAEYHGRFSVCSS